MNPQYKEISRHFKPIIIFYFFIIIMWTLFFLLVFVTYSSLTLVKAGRQPLEESHPNYWSWAALVSEVIPNRFSPHLYSSCHLLPLRQHHELPSAGWTSHHQTQHSSCGLCVVVRRGWAGSLEVTSWSLPDCAAGQNGARMGCYGAQDSRLSWRKGCWGHWCHSNNESQ